VITAGERAICVWKIPPLRQRDGDDVVTIEAPTALFTIQYNIAEPMACTSVTTASWYSYNPSGASRTSFDLSQDLLFDEVDAVEISRFVIRPTNPLGDSPTHIPVSMTPSFYIRGFREAQARSIQSGTNDYYLIWFEDGQLFIHLSTHNDEDIVVSQTYSAIDVGPADDPESDEHALVACPFSGRVCLALADGILVMDLVRP
jgi:hypothetical protein